MRSGRNPTGGILFFLILAGIGLALLFLITLLNLSRRSRFTRLFISIRENQISPDEVIQDFHFSCAKKSYTVPLSQDKVETLLNDIISESYEESGINAIDFIPIDSRSFLILAVVKSNLSYFPGSDGYFSVIVKNYFPFYLGLTEDFKKASITTRARENEKEQASIKKFSAAMLNKLNQADQ